VGGTAALIEKKRGPKGPHPNRVAKEIEQKILDLCLEQPTWGAQRVSNELRLSDVNASAKRSHQGYRLKGRTPAQALREALGKKRLPPVVPNHEKEPPKQAA